MRLLYMAPELPAFEHEILLSSKIVQTIHL